MIKEVIARVGGLSKGLDVLDQRMSSKFKDYSDRCLALAEIAQGQSKAISDLTAELEAQKKGVEGLHGEVSALSESVNAQILAAALQIASPVAEASSEELDFLNARVVELQKEVESLRSENKHLELTVKAGALTAAATPPPPPPPVDTHSEEIAELKTQIEELKKELDKVEKEKNVLELKVSLAQPSTEEASHDKSFSDAIAELTEGLDRDGSEEDDDAELKLNEEDDFYYDRNMKAINKAEKLLVLVSSAPSFKSSTGPSPKERKHRRSRSPASGSKKKK